MASVDRAIEASAGNAHACIFRYVVDSDFVVHEGDGVAVMYGSRKKKKKLLDTSDNLVHERVHA